MARRKKEQSVPPLSPDVLQRIGSTLKPVQPETQLPRKGQRGPILSLGYPARGRFSARAIRMIGDCAISRGQESRLPQAVQALDSDVPGYIILEPVQVYDPKVPSQYPISWAAGGRRAFIELRSLLHPRNLETPEGYIAEMVLSLEELPSTDQSQARTYIFLHVANRHIRPEGEVTPGEEDDFTASDDDLQGASPASEAAPGREEG